MSPSLSRSKKTKRIQPKTARCGCSGCGLAVNEDGVYCATHADPSKWNRCVDCDAPITKLSTRCSTCSNKRRTEQSKAKRGPGSSKATPALIVDNPETVATIRQDNRNMPWVSMSANERGHRSFMARALVNRGVLSLEMSKNLYPEVWDETN
jgi:hypothetical protein